MNSRLTLRTLICLICLLSTVAQSSDEFDFDQIDQHLSDEIKTRIGRYQGQLQLAREGVLSAQVILAYDLRKLSPESALLIARHLVDRHGVIPDQATDFDLFMISRLLDDLTAALIDPDHPWFDPEQAFAIATQHDLGFRQVPSMTWSLLHHARWLPDVSEVMDAWQHEDEENRTYGNLQAWLDSLSDPIDDGLDEPVDNRENLDACPNAFGDTTTVLQTHRRLQSDFLRDGQVDAQELAEYRRAMNAIDDHAANSSVTFQFEKIPSRVILNMLFDLGLLQVRQFDDSATLALSPQIESRTLPIHVTDINALLLFAMLLDQLGLAVYCNDDLVLVDHADSNHERSESPVLISGLLMERTPLADGNVRLEWIDGNLYEGQVRDNLPHGAGTLKVRVGSEQMITYQGVFHGDQLSGQVRIHNVDGTLRYDGQMLGGLYHGQGRLYDRFEGYDFEGPFEHGRFSGTGKVHYMNPLDPLRFQGVDYPADTVVYEGPVSNDQPHGHGTCSQGTVHYPCTYHEGILIGIGQTSLIPGVLQVPSFDETPITVD